MFACSDTNEYWFHSSSQVWEKLPTVPLRYNFYFEALDGDYEGNYVGNDSDGFMDPEVFKISDPSPLQMITMCVQSETMDKVNHLSLFFCNKGQ